MTTLTRTTNETNVLVELRRDGGDISCETSIPFLDHMLATLARYAGLGLIVSATGDLPHHLSEDVAITLGAALSRELPPSAARFGDMTIPMDDALVHVCIDVGGRAFYGGALPVARYDHWMRSFADNLHATLHVRVLRGRDRHHVVEAAFKALGICLRQAMANSEKGGAVFSTKGMVSWRESATPSNGS